MLVPLHRGQLEPILTKVASAHRSVGGVPALRVMSGRRTAALPDSRSLGASRNLRSAIPAAQPGVDGLTATARLEQTVVHSG